MTRRDRLPEAACEAGEDLSEFINDLHVWFRSFRAKLSRLGVVCAGLKREANPVSSEIQ